MSFYLPHMLAALNHGIWERLDILEKMFSSSTLWHRGGLYLHLQEKIIEGTEIKTKNRTMDPAFCYSC